MKCKNSPVLLTLRGAKLQEKKIHEHVPIEEATHVKIPNPVSELNINNQIMQRGVG